MNIAQILQQRQQAEASAPDSKPAAPVVVDPLIGPMVEPPLSQQVTARAEDGSAIGLDQPTAESVEPLPPGPPGSYRALRLQRFFKSSGQKVEPNAEGFFIPADEEERAQLEHHAKTYDMVEYQGDPVQSEAS